MTLKVITALVAAACQKIASTVVRRTPQGYDPTPRLERLGIGYLWLEAAVLVLERIGHKVRAAGLGARNHLVEVKLAVAVLDRLAVGPFLFRLVGVHDVDVVVVVDEQIFLALVAHVAKRIERCGLSLFCAHGAALRQIIEILNDACAGLHDRLDFGALELIKAFPKRIKLEGDDACEPQGKNDQEGVKAPGNAAREQM
jgi:hypothetical protein